MNLILITLPGDFYFLFQRFTCQSIHQKSFFPFRKCFWAYVCACVHVCRSTFVHLWCQFSPFSLFEIGAVIAGLWVSGDSLVSASHLTRVIDATSPDFTWVLSTQTQALMHSKCVYPLSHFSNLLVRIPSLVPFLNYKIPEGSMCLLLSSSFSWSSLYFRLSPPVSISHGMQLSPCLFLVSKLTETWIDSILPMLTQCIFQKILIRHVWM